MAGHSRWANIKHKKAKSDALRGRLWSKCARAIIVAARNGGGDPNANLTLRYAMDEAKQANMPRITIDNAIKKGTGDLGGVNYENVVYEGYGPQGVAILLDILTDNRHRTAGELRLIFERSGGRLAVGGSVAYLFTSKGQMTLPKSAATEEQVIQIALEAGAQDVEASGDDWLITTDPTALAAVRQAIQKGGLEVQGAQLTRVPTTTVSCTGELAKRILALIEALDEHDDVKKVHANFDIPDEELALLEAGG